MFKPDRQKRVKGGLRPFSSAPCRVKGQRPLWGLGQRPNGCSCDQLCKSTQSCPTSAEQRSAFSAALVTLRSRRSAPKLLFPPCCTLSRQMGATAHPGVTRKSSRTRRPAAFICLIHFAQCFSFGSMSAKYARTCSGCHASFDMCGTRNASSSSNELYANFPSV